MPFSGIGRDPDNLPETIKEGVFTIKEVSRKIDNYSHQTY
jgi:hypothetical protein